MFSSAISQFGRVGITVLCR